MMIGMGTPSSQSKIAGMGKFLLLVTSQMSAPTPLLQPEIVLMTAYSPPG